MKYEILENTDFDELYLEYAKFRMDYEVISHEYKYSQETRLHTVKIYYIERF